MLFEKEYDDRKEQQIEQVYICCFCGKECTQYGRDLQGNKFCYDCGATKFREELIEKGTIGGYLTKKEGKYFFGDWTGKFKVPVTAKRSCRVDFWFVLEGKHYYGKLQGSYNEYCTVRRLKNG
jgi:hypothetical protein